MFKKHRNLVITVFNVGHGDNILIEFPGGEIGIVDSCIPEGAIKPPVLDRLLEIRKERKIKRNHPLEVEFLCVTHPHKDHIRGILQILTDDRINVKELWHSISSHLDFVLDCLNKTGVKRFAGGEAIAPATRFGSPIRELLEAFKFAKDQKRLIPLVELRDYRRKPSIGGVELVCISPSDVAVTRYIRRIEKDIMSNQDKARSYANRLSIVLHLKYGRKRVILGADAVRANWREAINTAKKIGCFNELFPADVMKAPHHGSSNTFYDGLWDVLLRKGVIVAISTGGGELPTEEFIQKLPEECSKYCTNFGQCKFSPLYKRFPEDDFLELVDRTCCGRIEITVPRWGSILVKSDYPPKCAEFSD